MGYHTCHGVVMGYRLIQPLPTRWWTNDDLAPAPGESPKSWSTKSTSDPQIVADPMTISYQLWKTSQVLPTSTVTSHFFRGFPLQKPKKHTVPKRNFSTPANEFPCWPMWKAQSSWARPFLGTNKRWKAHEFLVAQTISVPNFWVMMIKGKQRKGVSSAKLKKKTGFV